MPSDTTTYLHLTVPYGSVQRLYEVGAVPKVVGPQTGLAAAVLAAGTSVVGVRFRPDAAAAVLGLPVSKLTRPFELVTCPGIHDVPRRPPIASPPGIGGRQMRHRTQRPKRASPAVKRGSVVPAVAMRDYT